MSQTIRQRQHPGGATPAASGPVGRGHGRQRGSLLILCVTVLVIIALVGIAFLQRVRLDQAATARHERNYMDLVINGILVEISNHLTDDLFDNAKDPFDPADQGLELYDYPWTKSIREVNATREFSLPRVITVNGAGRNIGPNTFVPTHEDDRWLASTAPVFNPATNTYNWLHLTNLTGIWLDLENAVEQPIIGLTPGDLRNSDTDIPIPDLERLGARTEPLGVDADLDGIMDSRWQWVPTTVRDFAGRKYVMAVRIVDLNSMLNVNTATIGSLDGNTPFNGGAPRNQTMRGYAPTGVDLGRLFLRVDYNNTQLINNAAFSGDWIDEIQTLLNKRALQNTSAPLLLPPIPAPLTAIQNRDLWERQASIYGNIDRNYLADSEMELRRLGGVNDFSVESPLEVNMPKLLRQASEFQRLRGVEASFLDVVQEAASSNRAISKWFYGHTNGDGAFVKDRRFPGIRHMLTTASGVGAYNGYRVQDPGGPAANRDAFGLKLDLKRQWAKLDTFGQTDRIGGIRDRIRQAFRLPSPSTPNTGWYLGIVDPRVQADLIEEYTLAIQDYSDPDNVPSVSRGFYGMERLPFLREVYIQALYADVLGDANGKAPWETGYDSSMPGTDYVGWEYDTAAVGGDTRAMVIELGNPFAHRINGTDRIDPFTGRVELNGLDNRVRVVVRQNGAVINTWTFGDASSVTVPTPDIDARNDADPGDILLILSPPVDQISETGGTNDGSKLLTEVGVTNGVKWLELQPGTLTTGFVPGGGVVTVELQVRAQDNVWVTYDRLETDPLTALPVNATHNPSPNANNQFAQASFARDSLGIHYVVDDGVAAGDLQATTPSTSGYSTSTARLGNDLKGSAAIATYPGDPTFFDRLQLPMADRPMRSVAELAWIHMFGFTSAQTFSERMSASGSLGLPSNEHFLLLDPTDPSYRVLPPPPNGPGIPHAAVLMDLFTTVSPRNDGRDNDNDDGDDNPLTSATATLPDLPSIDNETEQFIPGTINVNTAPLHVMTLGAPLGENLDETEALMRTIVAYRDQPTRAAAGYPDDPATPFTDTDIRLMVNATTGINRMLTKPGIGSLGELLFLDFAGGGSPFDMQRYGRDGAATLPATVDLYPDPEEVSFGTANNGNYGDDNEQRVARFQMLGQTFTVRSDRFVVYAVVRGYDNVSAAAPRFDDLAETAQFIAVFDRGSMQSKNDSPRVIGFVRLQ
jgi:hypothetical protein